MSFGIKLKLLRTMHKLDQNKMSERLNISQPVYSRYENDDKKVSLSDTIVQKVAKEFNVTGEWLTSTDNTNIVFENGSITNGATGIGKIDHYYSVPKDFLDAFIKQQKMTEEILAMLVKK